MDNEMSINRKIAVEKNSSPYCPRCERDGSEGETLCVFCGELLLIQGYCPVCREFWKLPAGKLCPKHDLALEEARPVMEFDPAWGSIATWTTVGTFADTHEADASRIRLEAEGIPTFLEGERMGGRSMYQVATGGIKLKVPATLAPDARVLLAQSWTLPPSDEDLDDAWDDLAPEPGARRRVVMRGVLLFLLFGPALFSLLAWFASRIS
ncbi:MAG: hypothetical protein NVSMB9_35520 [Isosphaeraceae bacterium]